MYPVAFLMSFDASYLAGVSNFGAKVLSSGHKQLECTALGGRLSHVMRPLHLPIVSRRPDYQSLI